jgi:hypothetical protein
VVGDRGWAGRLLVWCWRGVHLEAEIARVRYFIRGCRHEVVAWCEVRDVCGRVRVDVGTFRSVKSGCGGETLLASRSGEGRPNLKKLRLV